MKKIIFFIFIFLTSFLLADLSVYSIGKIANYNIYAIDVIYFFIFYAFFNYLRAGNSTKTGDNNIYYFFLITVIVFSIFYGITRYGFRAVGEARYVYNLFGFFVPYYIFSSEKYTTSEIKDFFCKTIIISAVASLILFIIELFYGGRVFFTEENLSLVGMTDHRGTRYLGSEETYNILVLALFIFLLSFQQKKIVFIKVLLIVTLLSVVFFTQNRTAIISLFAGLVIILLLNNEKKVFLYFTLIAGLFYLSLIFFMSELFQKLYFTLSTSFDVFYDNTGNWRYLVQYSAIIQSLDKPIFGDGFGAYFNIYVPEWGKTIDLPPHNIFVYLFMKSGIIGVISAVFALCGLVYEMIKNKSLWLKNNMKAHYFLIQTIITSQFFYGMAYGFSLYFGLFAGFATLINIKLKQQDLINKNS